MMMTINLEKTLIAKEEKSYENSLSELEAKDTVSRWYDDTASWPGQIPV
jgi:phage FluMu protein gp41